MIISYPCRELNYNNRSAIIIPYFHEKRNKFLNFTCKIPFFLLLYICYGFLIGSPIRSVKEVQ
ncbi:hypothetical protein CLOSYM_04757 [[Clostridium] symbiosum ATCC 14940]|uniref:Uncharacterized protein n=1 Tax=[Clostridium] symbiosum ATCC 14940 TaxID=411472 RepID=A0ABC9TQZ4_CLOSY|nr:hypothetical protein CLOSYM_04757 [[Clostridium] symbiosum ATCC 14940]